MQVVWTALPDLKGQEKKQILETLGYSAYDMLAIAQNKEHFIAWNDYAVGRSKLDWKELTSDYDTMIQTSGVETLHEIMDEFPDIKIIIEKIDGETYNTRFNKMLKYRKLFRWARIFPSINRALILIEKYLYKHFAMDYSSENVKKYYTNYFNEVIKSVPKEQLLIVDEKSSWAEICTFLGKPIPRKTFPANIGKPAITSRLKNTLVNDLKKRWLLLTVYFGTLVSLIIYLMYFYEG